MKKLIIISLSLIATSCSKTWECTTTYKTEVNPTCPYLSSSSYEQSFEFNGTKSEMKEYMDGAITEEMDTVCQDIIGSDECDYCIITTMNCVRK